MLQMAKGRTFRKRTEFPDWVSVATYAEVHELVNFSEQGFGYEWDGDEWYPINHTGRVVIGSGATIHPGTVIVRATADDGMTVIGEGTKIDSLCHIAHNAKIGKYCLLESMVDVAGSAEIGDRCLIGGHVYIRNKVKVGNDCQILPGSVVRHDLPDGTIYSDRYLTYR